ncbi:MAG TPA: isoleucine--tRNA ligase [Candidatus Nanoarchaeia archaeon]|nr:isoleucine--tRNA ligase [Candidatus Nanoarchaeia archaeon]
MYDFKNVEEEIRNFWDEKRIFDKLRKKNKGKKRWSFIDGPITANNPMGVHHAWGRTYKDLFHRFKAMQGHEIRYQNGFDAQGLWIEREEEKDLGLKNKKEIEKFGIKKFVESCKRRVEKFSKIQTEQSIKLGMWMDWENSYYTNTDNNNLHNWFLLKKYFEKGWLYKGNDVVPWCPRCGTASSKHDIVTEGYREVTHNALFMKFPIEGRKKEFFLIFTTTPWTVPANVAIAANEKSDYVKIKQEDNFYWIAKKRLNEIKGDYKVVEEKKGNLLKGIRYIMPYGTLPEQKKVVHSVVMWDLASDEEGTGFVHVAPGCGSEDYALGKKLKLPVVAPLNDVGFYEKNYGNFSGKKYSEVNREVLDDLEKIGFVYKIEKIKHRYPHCWRCGEELVFRLVDEWYIKSKDMRKKLINENKKVKWYPEYGNTRQEDWFENMDDWLISRKRYYGLPLPIWECKGCGKIEVIENIKELRNKAVDKKKVDELKEIHRPWVDEIKIKCEKCGEEVSRIEDVGDAWLDAGIVPFSTLNYLQNKKYWNEWFPADLISENLPGQYRGWFNALSWASVALTGKLPFKAVFGYETVKDEKGEEMHKSKGNAIWFDEAVEKVGADTMRLLYCQQNPSQELRFGFNVLKEQKNQINILYNMEKLIEKSKSKKQLKIEDRWIISRLNSVIKDVTEEIEKLHPHTATKFLYEFWLNDLSRKYIQIVRDRLSSDDESAKNVLGEVYVELLKLCAPFMPFVAEKIWQNLKKRKIVSEESVHLCDWPKSDKRKIDKNMEKRMENATRIIETGLMKRDKAGMGLRWPLAKINVLVKGKENYKDFEGVIKTQLNIKKIQWKSPASKGTEFDLELDTTLTPELEAEGYARELARQIQAFRKNLNLKKEDFVDTRIIVGESEFSKILESQKKFLKERTNSKKFEILVKNVTTDKERFKNIIDFTIKNKRGIIEIIIPGQ